MKKLPDRFYLKVQTKSGAEMTVPVEILESDLKPGSQGYCLNDRFKARLPTTIVNGVSAPGGEGWVEHRDLCNRDGSPLEWIGKCPKTRRKKAE